MDPLSLAIAKIGTQLSAGLTSAAGRRAKTALLGEPQRRALDIAVRQSAEAAGAHHPEIAQISGDIYPLSTEAAIDELLACAAHGDVRGWPAATAAWRDIYGTEPLDEFVPFLTELATELAQRMRARPDLELLFLIESSDQIRAEVLELREHVDAQVDPIKAVRHEGERIGSDLRFATEIIGQVGSEMSRGPVGRAFNVDATLTPEGAHFRLRARPGADVRVNLGTRATDSAEARRRIEAVRSSTREVELEEADIQLLVDGLPVPLPTPLQAFVGPVTARQHVVLEFRTRGLRPERFLATVETRFGRDSIRASSYPESAEPLLVTIEVTAKTPLRASFSTNPKAKSVRNQLKLARLMQHLRRGCRVRTWLVEPDASGETALPPQPGYDVADSDVQALSLFESVQRRLGAELGEVELLTPLDMELLRAAKQLLDKGEATLPAIWDTLTVRTAHDLRPRVSSAARRRRTLPLVLGEQRFILPLTRHPLVLGPVTVGLQTRWPPEQVTEEGDAIVTVLKCLPGRRISLRRGVPQ